MTRPFSGLSCKLLGRFQAHQTSPQIQFPWCPSEQVALNRAPTHPTFKRCHFKPGTKPCPEPLTPSCPHASHAFQVRSEPTLGDSGVEHPETKQQGRLGRQGERPAGPGFPLHSCRHLTSPSVSKSTCAFLRDVASTLSSHSKSLSQVLATAQFCHLSSSPSLRDINPGA